MKEKVENTFAHFTSTQNISLQTKIFPFKRKHKFQAHLEGQELLILRKLRYGPKLDINYGFDGLKHIMSMVCQKYVRYSYKLYFISYAQSVKLQKDIFTEV